MFYRFVRLSVLILVSAVAASPPTLAQSADISFSGRVSDQVTFSAATAGNLAPTTSFTVDGSSNTVESVTPATVTIQSRNPTTIKISPPILVSGPTPDPAGTKGIGFLQVGTTSVRSDVGNGTATLPAGDTNVEVSMRVERPVPYTAGVYKYAVTLTIIP